MSVSIAIAETVSVWSRLAFELFQVFVRATEHPNRELKLEVRVRDRHVVVEHPFDRFLWPRPILEGEPRIKKGARNPASAIMSGGGGNVQPKTHRSLTGHDELHGTLNRLRVRILGIHQRHRCPARLHHLRLFVLNPTLQLARLPAFSQSACLSAQVQECRTPNEPCSSRPTRHLSAACSPRNHTHAWPTRSSRTSHPPATVTPGRTASRT